MKDQVPVAKETQSLFFCIRDRAAVIIMALRYTIKAIFDDVFRLSDGESSNEDGEDIYGYVGEPILRRADVRDLGESIVAGHLVDREEEGTDILLQVSEQDERDISSACLTSDHECSDDNSVISFNNL